MFTYDPATPAGTVRRRISDVDEDNAVFTDDEIAAFLTDVDGNTWHAAASALEAIAANEVFVQKRIRILDLTTDGPAEARELRALAATWWERGDSEDEPVIGLAPTRFGYNVSSDRFV